MRSQAAVLIGACPLRSLAPAADLKTQLLATTLASFEAEHRVTRSAMPSLLLARSLGAAWTDAEGDSVASQI